MARRNLGLVLLLSSLWKAGAIEQKPIPQQGSNERQSKAQLVLYSGSRLHPEDLRAMRYELPGCSDDGPSTTAELETDVCLSGDYYLKNNLKITRTPVCPDGSTPKLIVYQQRGCTGREQNSFPVGVFSGRFEEEPTCSWMDTIMQNPSYYWSLVFRCDTGNGSSPLLRHQSAIPPSIIPELKGPTRGWTKTHTASSCGDVRMGRRLNGLSLPNHVDTCHWPISDFTFTAMEVTVPALCANGTRARLARMEDTGENQLKYYCNSGKNTFREGLVDVNDEDVERCIGMQGLELTSGGVANALGAMFYCDGLEFASREERLKSQDPAKKAEMEKIYEEGPALVSHSTCARLGELSARRRPPTFIPVEAEMCVNLPHKEQVQLFQNTKCADGTPARVARWDGPNCQGLPERTQDFDGGKRNCLKWAEQGVASYMFQCGLPETSILASHGDNPGSASRTAEHSDARAIVSWDNCPISPVKPGWLPMRSNAGMIQRVEANKCLGQFAKAANWKIIKSVTCPSGEPAKLGVWAGSRCQGEMRYWKDVSELGECSRVCDLTPGRCSVAFWCEDEEVPPAFRQKSNGMLKDSDAHSRTPPQAGPVATTVDPTYTMKLWWVFWAGGALAGLILLLLGAILSWPFFDEIKKKLETMLRGEGRINLP